MTISERFSLARAYQSVNESKADVLEYVEDPNEAVKAKMAAHGFHYNDIDSDPENGYIAFDSSDAASSFPLSFKSWEEVSDWVNSVEFDDGFNDTGVSEADEFGRPDDLFAKMAAIQSHRFDRNHRPSKDELRKQIDADTEKAKAAGTFVKLDSDRVQRDTSSKYDETVVVPGWMVKDVAGKPGTNVEQWIGPSRLDKNKLEVAGSFEKGTQAGFAYTNGYIACLRYAIPYWYVVGRTEDGGVKIKVPLNRGTGRRYKFYEKPFGYTNRRGSRVLSFLARNRAPEYISSEELLSRIDGYISAVKQYGGIENYMKLGEELRAKKIAEIEAAKNANAERAADMDAADAAMYGDEVMARESVVSEGGDDGEAHGPQLVDVVAYNIEWDEDDKASGEELPERVEVQDMTFNPDEDNMEDLLRKYILDNYGCEPDALDYDFLDWKGEYSEESVDVTNSSEKKVPCSEDSVIAVIRDEQEKPTVDFTKSFDHDVANQLPDEENVIVPTIAEDEGEGGGEGEVAKDDTEYPKPCDALYNLKTVKAAQRLVYGVVSPHTKGIFHDDNWSNIQKIFEIMSRELGMNVNWGVRDDNFYQAGYSPDGKSKAYRFDAKFRNCVGRNVKLNGQIVASGAGTVEEPMKAYDISFMLF